jgi:hypothetical protein
MDDELERIWRWSWPVKSTISTTHPLERISPLKFERELRAFTVEKPVWSFDIVNMLQAGQHRNQGLILGRG